MIIFFLSSWKVIDAWKFWKIRAQRLRAIDNDVMKRWCNSTKHLYIETRIEKKSVSNGDNEQYRIGDKLILTSLTDFFPVDKHESVEKTEIDFSFVLFPFSWN